jgi:SNF2 family DNA or RNA helicase
MRWHVFHGNKRKLDLRNISSFDIILTTYDIVVAEYRKVTKSVDDFSIFSILWRRIILDEGR